MKVAAALFGGVLMASVSGAALAEAVVEKFDANAEWNWEGELKYVDGKMELCSVQSSYQNDILMFMLDRERNFMLGIISPDWTLKKESKAPITYWVDSYKEYKGTAVAAATTAIIVELPKSDTLFEQLRKGGKLNFDFRDETFWYGLDGTKKALEALWTCVDRGLATEAMAAKLAGQAKAPATVGDPVIPAPVREAAAPAAATSFGELTLGTSKEATGAQQRVFSPDTPKIFVNAQLLNVANGVLVRGDWIAEKTDVAPANYKIDSAEMTVNTFQNVANFSLSRPDAGWPVGDYRVDLFVNGKVDKTVRFRVEK